MCGILLFQDVRVFTISVTAKSKRYRRLMRDRDLYKAQMSPRIIRGAATTRNPLVESYHIIILRMPGQDGELWLLFRDSDEYLIAFRNMQGIWFQFFDHAVPANFNPRRLRLKGSHTRMTDGSHSSRTVGRFTLWNAYANLVNFNELMYGPLQRRNLHACTLVFSEASRFRFVRRLICYNMDNNTNTVLTSLMWDKIFYWKHMSSYVLRCEQQGEAKVEAKLAELGVTCFRDAVAELFLLKYDALYF
ncbi:hypothetical protein ACQ4PT_045433 [Festuca glaucescens]